MRRPDTSFLMRAVLCIFLAVACSSCKTPHREGRILTSGHHIPKTTEVKTKGLLKVVVWGNHPGMVNWLTQGLLKDATVVERARLQQVLDEQLIRLTHTADDEADLLRVGKILGADRILFAEATIRPVNMSGAMITPQFGGGSYNRTMYHLSVSLRMVKVETAEVSYSGTASFTLPVSENPDTGIEILTRAAVTRAVCPLEEGYTWVEDDGLIDPSTAGCHPPGK